MSDSLKHHSLSSLHPCFLTEEQLLAECQISQLRRGGPGGQHRNKVSTAILLIHQPTTISAEASERRNQVDNRRVAIRRLRESMAIRVRSSTPESSADDHLMVSDLRFRYGGAKLRIAEDNWERPQVLAVMLDDLQRLDQRLNDVAQLWRTSPSQVIRLLKDFPAAMKNLNEERRIRHLAPLK